MNTDKIYAESIAKEYAPKQASKTVALRKLDAKAKNPANIFAYTFGTVMCLLFGTGMCLGMKVIGPDSVVFFILGIVLGIIGIVGMSINYSIYRKLLEEGKKKYAFEIMTLAKEICEEE